MEQLEKVDTVQIDNYCHFSMKILASSCENQIFAHVKIKTQISCAYTGRRFSAIVF